MSHSQKSNSTSFTTQHQAVAVAAPDRDSVSGRVIGTSQIDNSSSAPFALPGWLASIIVHSLLLVGFAFGLRGCGSGSSLSASGEFDNFREVGIHIRNSKPTDQQNESESNNKSNAEPNPTETTPIPSSQSLNVANSATADSEPPLALSLPDSGPNLIGAGIPQSTSGTGGGSPGELLRPNAIKSSGGSAQAGGTSFFGIRDRATRFVYVVDRSGSMHGAPLIAAKSELIRSLRQLESTHQFQVLFYSGDRQDLLNLDQSRKPGLYWATNINVTLAEQRISSITAGEGTNHKLALLRALRMTPEVIFFLTDADEPSLTAAELEAVRIANRSRTRIHAVQFGKGADLALVNFLKKLAKQNGGTYRYQDTNVFRR